MKDKYNLSDEKALFLKLFGLYCIAYFGIFRADFNYLDDIGRKAFGYHGWLDFGRWTTTILSNFVHADAYLSDISPLPQILGAACIALAGVLIFKSLSERKHNWVDVLALSMIGLCPYFMGCICYKYDSFYMSLSVLASVVPFLFYHKDIKKYCVVSVVALLIMCTTYQASNGIYPMMVIAITYVGIIKGDKLVSELQWIASSIICFVVSLSFFQIFLLKNKDNVEYTGNGLKGVVIRYVDYYKLMLGDFKLSWLALIVLLILIFLLFHVFIYSKNGKNVFAVLGLSLLAIALFSVMVFGAYLFVGEGHWDFRTYLGIGALLAILSLLCSDVALQINNKFFNTAFIVVLVALSWSFFTNAFVVGNAFAEQKRYTESRIQMVVDDINELGILDDQHETKIQIIGELELSPVIRSMSGDCDYLPRLIPTEFGSGTWGYTYMMEYYGLPSAVYNDPEDLSPEDYKLLKETTFYSLYGDEDTIIIVLNTL